MQPRLMTSLQWTPFPQEFADKILQVFSENFGGRAAGGEFLVDGRIYPQEILVRIGYLAKGRLRQVNFEASMEYSMEKGDEKNEAQPAQKAIYACVDMLGSVFEEYLASETQDEIEFPLHWQAYDFEDSIVWLQHSTVNTRLEAEADKWLESADDKALVYDDGLSEDALTRAIVDTEFAQEVQKEIRKGPKTQ